jgi:hypothetical protein
VHELRAVGGVDVLRRWVAQDGAGEAVGRGWVIAGWGLGSGPQPMFSAVFAPLLRLSPPPGDHDYIYNLDESEGVCDLFDVPVLNL